ncbi:MAG: potassium-transporting ATPase KdpC subunit [Betaproteobacteria bacterium]
MKSLVRPAISMFVLLSLITGLIYPLLTTAIVTPLFGDSAAGSLIVGEGGRPVGSTLIGQNFTDPKYFWGRPSATSPYPYNARASGGSNLGPLNPALVEAVKGRVEVLRIADPDNQAPIPADLVTASGSGLDPEISPAAARYQAARVARARNLPPAKVNALIDAHTQGRQWGLFGEPRVNVLKLNLALDALSR